MSGTEGVLLISPSNGHPFRLYVEHARVVETPPEATYALGWSVGKACHYFQRHAQVQPMLGLLGFP